MTDSLISSSASVQRPPYKSVAATLLFCAILGPIGLLYASFWGGVCMMLLGIVVVSARFIFPIILLWMICCAWGVGAAESYNKKILKMFQQK